MYAPTLTYKSPKIGGMPPAQRERIPIEPNEGMADFPLKNLFVCASGNWSAFDQAVCAVGNDICWARGNRFTCDVRADHIENIFNVYRNLIKEDSNLYQYTDEPQDDKERDAMNVLIKAISDRSGQNQAFVKEVLKALYWATKDGRVKSTDILLPRSAAKGEDKRDPGGSRGITDTLDKITTYGIPILIIGVAIYGASQIAKIVSAFKGTN